MKIRISKGGIVEALAVFRGTWWQALELGLELLQTSLLFAELDKRVDRVQFCHALFRFNDFPLFELDWVVWLWVTSISDRIR